MKKLISSLLVWAMLLSAFPMAAFAAAEANLWEGKSAVFVGDSITYGSGTTKIYHQYLKESLGLGSVTSMGVAGSCISATSDYGHTNQPLMDRYGNVPDADLIVVFMGTNDYGHESPLGTMADTTDVSFYGALNVIVPALVAAHPSSKIVFATPLHRYGFGSSKLTGAAFTYDNIPNGRGATLGDYAAAIKEVCAAHGVSVMDLYEEYPLDPSDAAVRAQYMPDGLHPNAQGHQIIADVMEEHIRSYTPVEREPNEEPEEQPELVYGNRFASGYSQQNRASSRVNFYLPAGTKIIFKHTDTMQWACTKTDGETSNNNRGYFPDSAWSDKETAEVTADGWVGFTFKYRDESQVFDLTTPLSEYITIEIPHDHAYTPTVTAPTCTQQGYTTYTCACGDSYVDNYTDATGHRYDGSLGCSACGYKAKVSVLGDSISTYSGIYGVKNAVYPNSSVTSVAETWWKQVVDALGGEVLKVNASGGSRILSDEYFNGAGIRDGNYAAYRDRCINLHVDNDKPDVILVFMGTNDFSYHVESECAKCQNLLSCIECTGRADGNLNVCAACRAASGVNSSFCNLPLGTADSADISNETPTSSCEAYALMLSKMRAAYSDAQIYCLGLLPRVNPYQNVVYHDHGQPTAFNAELKKVAENAGATFIDLERCVDNGAATWNTYFGDAVHPSATGMDRISDAVMMGMLGYTVYSVTASVVHGVTLSGASWAVAGDVYEASITVPDGMQAVVRVTMNGTDITDTAYDLQKGKIYIDSVSGSVEIVITEKQTPEKIWWSIGAVNSQNGALVDMSTRIRTNLYEVTRGAVITADNGAEFCPIFYDERGTFVISPNEYDADGVLVVPAGKYAYMRLMVRNRNNIYETLTPAYGENIAVAFGSEMMSWSVGTIYCGDNASGADANNYKNRIRTGFIAVGDGVTVRALASSQINVVFYDADFKILPTGNNCGWATEWNSADAPPATAYIRVAAKDDSDRNLTVDYGANVIFSYTHDHAYTPTVTAPTCTQQGYTTYTCACGDSYVGDYTDAHDHTYDHAYDPDCNVCGDVRETDVPIAFGGNSVSEDVSGLAFRFAVTCEGMEQNVTTAIYDNATVGGYRLLSMGVVVTNGVATGDVPAVYLYDLTDTTATFAVRVIEIPPEGYGTDVTATPYIVLEIDGVATTIYGVAQTCSYNDGKNGF